MQDRCEIPGLNLGTAFVTAWLECGRGGWNSACSSEMRRYAETPMAKAIPWACTDAHARKRGEQTGLDTLVVHALNDVNWLLDGLLFSNEANA